jgi:glucosamine--fructose-6-phosphate aminotransferase (isomerizing)
MCGLFGVIGNKLINSSKIVQTLIDNAESRGRDAAGALIFRHNAVSIYRADERAKKLFTKIDVSKSNMLLGHSRLITSGFTDNQPIFRDGTVVLHNGIIVNADQLWETTRRKRTQQLDSEIIAAIFADELEKGLNEDAICEKILAICEGVVSAIIYLPGLGKTCLISNNGSMYLAQSEGGYLFASEKWPLSQLNCTDIDNIKGVRILTVEKYDGEIIEKSVATRHRRNLVPNYITFQEEEIKLNYIVPELRRCTKCILPETMPFIAFDDEGVCNYCHHYEIRNKPKSIETLKELVAPYRQSDLTNCVVPFSGGRDSCFALHIIVNELKMRPVAYTYDWGMVTDLGRRNISRMCAALGVENIIVAADIEKKRTNIRLNLNAWLKKPHLGMLNLLMAGDKHFFRHVETVKNKTGALLNLWGINPLETTHFKSGFLGIAPSFHSESVYKTGWLTQIGYQKKRFAQMVKNPSYFNRSLYDTISGEYWRSLHKKNDYFHVFDYYRWDETEVNETLKQYNWETAIDTKSTWRIGDGTAAFYNYVYHRTAGFSEHDTFRSNQIREGQLSRDMALMAVAEENRPRYPNIKWYLDAVGIDFNDCINRINSMKTLY